MTWRLAASFDHKAQLTWSGPSGASGAGPGSGCEWHRPAAPGTRHPAMDRHVLKKMSVSRLGTSSMRFRVFLSFWYGSQNVCCYYIQRLQVELEFGKFWRTFRKHFFFTSSKLYQPSFHPVLTQLGSAWPLHTRGHREVLTGRHTLAWGSVSTVHISMQVRSTRR